MNQMPQGCGKARIIRREKIKASDIFALPGIALLEAARGTG
jgi:hypothetical protein